MAPCSESHVQELAQRLLDVVHDSWKSQAIHAFAQLSLADQLADGPKDTATLARATESDEASLYRLLRASSTLGLVVQEPDGKFGLTEMGTLLCDDSPNSVRNWTLWWGHALWPVWGNLTYSVQTGESARKLLTGTKGFAHIENDPNGAHIFNRGLAELTRIVAQSVVRAFDFRSFNTIMDLGGGYGELIATILEACPESKGILVDMPHSIEGAKAHLSDAGLAGRSTCIAGDFFENIPSDADAVLLKSVIHDWNDEDALRILSVCRRDMRPDAKLFVIERIMPAKLGLTKEHQILARADLSMLVIHAARERSEEDMRRILSSAGFQLSSIFPTDSGFSILVATPA
jgi:orsellinic acid C2-O-methyltransferase